MSVQRCCQEVSFFWNDKSMTNWAATDYLINYQGGFVRRGMVGEILYQLRLHLGVDPLTLLTVVTVFCFILLVLLFVKSFWERRLQLFILPLAICFGQTDVVRKDSIMILLLWLILYCYLHVKSSNVKLGLSMLIAVFLLNIHEAALFFVWPLISLLILADNKVSGRMKAVGVAIPVVTFFTLAYFKGNVAMAQAIHDSWKAYLPAEWGDVPNTSIDAIGWGANNTFLMHLKLNYFTPDLDHHWLKGWMTRPFVYFFIYYLISNYPLFFRKGYAGENRDESILLSRIVLFQFIMLLPMFTILSCDLGRIVYYWTLSSFMFYFAVPRRTVERVFPGFYCAMADRIYAVVNRILPPSAIFLAAIMLVISITPVKFHVLWAEIITVLGSCHELYTEVYLFLATLVWGWIH